MKEESKIKFQVLCKVYSILSDADKKKIYDESGLIDGENDLFSSSKDWNEYWRGLFKKVTKEDVDKFFSDYKDSAEERADLLRLYEKHKGDMNLLMQEMISSDDLENEPRFRSIILEAIEQGQAASHSQFVNESKRKAVKRKNEQAREAKEAEEIKKKMNIDLESEESLKMAILSRRKQQNDNFLDKLAEKYSNPAKKAKGKASGKTKMDKDEDDEEEDESEEEDDDDEDDDEKDRKKKSTKKKVVGGGRGATAGAKKAKKIKRL
jgi:DnaJ family protein C protein 9